MSTKSATPKSSQAKKENSDGAGKKSNGQDKNFDGKKSQSYVEHNVDFTKTVKIRAGDVPFSPTPMKGVQRMLFERRGDEVARRATSIVKYDPKCYFKSHSHPGGEEFITLRGVFSDEHGDNPVGYYVRNYVGSAHAPHSEEGCEIFVKLAQLPPKEDKEGMGQFIIDMNDKSKWTKREDGSEHLQLWKSELEDTNAYKFPASYVAYTANSYKEVSEYFVITGNVTLNGEPYPERSWIRFAPNTPITLSSEQGAFVYHKIGTGEVREDAFQS